MHYYSHHIGDFIKDTARLTDSQCMAYLRMIWIYYDTESPLNDDADALAFEIGANALDVHQILKRFFFLHDDGKWHHSRCDKEILEFLKKSEKARNSAKARWDNANAMRTHNERNASASKTDATQYPLPITHEKDKTQTPEAPAKTPDEPPPEKPKPAKYKFESEHLELASRMAEPVQRRYPSQKINLDEWANAIRKLIELDGRKESEIMTLWIWVTSHDKPGFSWADTCRTPMKLREPDKQGAPYWDVIQQQRQRDTGLIRGSPKPGGVHQFDKIDYSAGVNPDGSF